MPTTTAAGRRSDANVPALLVKIGPYPLHHGGVGAIRSLGRLGAPVYAITERRATPAALSRYLRGAIVWPTTGLEARDELVAGLLAVGREVAARSRRDGGAGAGIVAIPTDDEAGVLLAENASELRPLFSLPDVAPGLPRRLADKNGLAELCTAHGIPSPRSYLPASAAELRAAAVDLGYPVVVKNAQPWTRLRRPAVGSSTVVSDPDALERLIAGWGTEAELPRVLVQEFLPGGPGSDWVANIYCPGNGAALTCFTGLKVRCWPEGGGVGSLLYAVPNDEIAARTAELCRRVDYRGVADLDWRAEPGGSGFRLLDFNPRVGAQFALFRNSREVDVVRALYLDLTGQEIPHGPQVYGRGMRVEHLDVPAALAARARRAQPLPGPTVPWFRIRPAWVTPRDPLPAAAAALLALRPAAAMARRVLRRRHQVALPLPVPPVGPPGDGHGAVPPEGRN
ncbi:MAG TPA: hypothetical protein VHT75_17225 [Acidimicrobiales bacterium]|nr:hypothetical protein [Acidimicrobiales bacterium]